MRLALYFHFTHLVLVGLPADVAPADSLHLHDDLLDLLVSDLLQDTDGAGLEEDLGVSEPPAVVEGLVLLQ